MSRTRLTITALAAFGTTGLAAGLHIAISTFGGTGAARQDTYMAGLLIVLVSIAQLLTLAGIAARKCRATESAHRAGWEIGYWQGFTDGRGDPQPTVVSLDDYRSVVS